MKGLETTPSEAWGHPAAPRDGDDIAVLKRLSGKGPSPAAGAAVQSGCAWGPQKIVA